MRILRYAVFLVLVVIAAALVSFAIEDTLDVFWSGVGAAGIPGGVQAVEVLRATRYVLPVLLPVLLFVAWRTLPARRGAAAMMVAVLSVAALGCASSSTLAPAAEEETSASCISSNVLYAWIDRCAPGGTYRVTWPRYFTWLLMDKVAGHRERAESVSGGTVIRDDSALHDAQSEFRELWNEEMEVVRERERPFELKGTHRPPDNPPLVEALAVSYEKRWIVLPLLYGWDVNRVEPAGWREALNEYRAAVKAVHRRASPAGVVVTN